MDTTFKSIENFLDSLHNNKPVVIEVLEEVLEDKPPIKPITNVEPLEIKILKQRMDSVSIVKYYRDLKNNKIKENDVSETLNSVEEMSDFITKNMEKKPWPRMDKFTKMKKIRAFVEKLLGAGRITIIDKKPVTDYLIKLLDDKKICKKNIEFDVDNNIVRLDKYSILDS
jgi:hypothetical protein